MIGGGMSLGQGRLVTGEALPFTHTYDAVGAGSEVVPAGAVQVIMTIIGNGAGGSRVDGAQGFGGGSGGKTTRTVAVVPGDAGKVILWEIMPRGLGRSGSIGAGADAGVINLSSNVPTAGSGLTNYTGSMACYLARGATTTAAGAGGTADGGGGATNTPGVAGGLPKGGPAPGGGAGGQTNGADGGSPGGGGAGGYKADGLQMDGGDGAPGRITFDWS